MVIIIFVFLPTPHPLLGFGLKYPPQALVLNAWFPAGGAILGGSGYFRRWGLAGGSGSLGSMFLDAVSYPFPSLFLPLFPLCHKVSSLYPIYHTIMMFMGSEPMDYD
jgi:hypothetical protein